MINKVSSKTGLITFLAIHFLLSATGFPVVFNYLNFIFFVFLFSLAYIKNIDNLIIFSLAVIMSNIIFMSSRQISGSILFRLIGFLIGALVIIKTSPPEKLRFQAKSLKSKKAPEAKFKKYLWLPLIFTGIYGIPYLSGSTTRKLTFFFGGYDNVVHFAVLKQVLKCRSSILFCDNTLRSSGSTPIDNYPSGWHSFFGYFFLKIGDRLSLFFLVYSVCIVVSLFMSLLLLHTAFMKFAPRVDSNFKKWTVLAFIYVGIPASLFLLGYQNYLLASAILVSSLVNVALNINPFQSALGLCIAVSMYSLFLPVAFLILLLVVFKNMSLRLSMFSAIIFLYPTTFFIIEQSRGHLITFANLASNNYVFAGVTFLLYFIFAHRKSKIEKITFSIIKIYSGVLFCFQIYLIKTGVFGGYYLNKMAIPLFIFELLYLPTILENLFFYKTLKKYSGGLLVTLLAIWWSVPSTYSSMVHGAVTAGGFKSPIVESALVLRNFRASGYGLENNSDAVNILNMSLSRSNFDNVIEASSMNFYRNTQWLGAITGNWSSKTQAEIDTLASKVLPNLEAIQSSAIVDGFKVHK